MHRPVIIFDFGNVVGFFDYTRIYERFAPILGIDLEELRLRLQRRWIRRASDSIRERANCPDRIRGQHDGAIGIEDSL